MGDGINRLEDEVAEMSSPITRDREQRVCYTPSCLEAAP